MNLFRVYTNNTNLNESNCKFPLQFLYSFILYRLYYTWFDVGLPLFFNHLHHAYACSCVFYIDARMVFVFDARNHHVTDTTIHFISFDFVFDGIKRYRQQ